MAITFRGQASKLKKSAASNNRNGFQEVSASGPRRGAGGFENSPAKKSCSPITQRSKSPLKMNEALVAGASQIGKKFVDVGAEVGKAFETKNKKPKAANLGSSEKGEEKDTYGFKTLLNKSTSTPAINLDNKVDEIKTNTVEQAGNAFGGGFADNPGFQVQSDDRYSNMFKQ